MRRHSLISVSFAVALLAGCFTPADGPTPTSPAVAVPGDIVEGLQRFSVTTASGPMVGAAAAGAISEFRFPDAGTSPSIRVPENVFRVEQGRFSAAHEFKATGGEAFHLLVPPGMTELTIDVDGAAVTIATPDTGVGLFRAENILDWYRVQRDEFPRRCNGCPNYLKSQPYFRDLFRSFGMAEVEVDPYGTNPLHADFANVVAYKYPKLDTAHPTWIGMGGHYDAVPGTVEAAFDDTSGTLVTLEMARVFANITTAHNMVFALWGGEESGLQGSQFFVRTNPNVALQMSLYVNHDADAFSWPGPAPIAADGSVPDCSTPVPKTRTADKPFYCPDPVLFTAGPDGPVADALLGLGRTIQQDVAVGYPDPYFIYEPVGEGQATGYSRINAQSDHASFIAAGVPSVFLINAEIENTIPGYHNPADTFANYTKYMVHNQYAAVEEELTAEETAAGEALMADAFETYLWLTFYMVLYEDLGLFSLTDAAPI